MTSSDCLPSNNRDSRLSNISHFNLPVRPFLNGTNEVQKSSSLSTTPISSSPTNFHTPRLVNQTRFPQSNMFNYLRHPPPLPPPPVQALLRKNIQFKPPEQDILDKNFFRTFNMEQKEELKNKNSENIINIGTTDSTSNHKHIDGPNLIDMGTDSSSPTLLSGNVFELFDPLKQPNRPHSWPSELYQAGTDATTPPFVTPSSETPTTSILPTVTSTSSLSYPYPIQLRLKLTIFPEIKPFSLLVQRIRNENQSKQTTTDEIIYCKRVQRLTPQHIEQKQLPVTLYIFVDGSKEPKRLTNISLQSTVSHILYQLLEITSFNYDQSILKLRSREEYLRNDDVLCDIEYVYNCINSLKQLQFVLVQKPTYGYQKHQKLNHISFEQFCLSQQEKTHNTLTSSLDISNRSQTDKKHRNSHRLSTVRQSKSLNLHKQATYSHQAHIAHSSNAPFLASDPRWLEEFQKDINLILIQIEQRFNRLVQFHQPILSINEQIKLINELIGFIKNIQVTCSYIQSSLIIDKQRDLKNFADQLIRKSHHEHEQQTSLEINEKLTRLLYDTLVILVNYIQTYCHAYLIPYEVEIYNDKNLSIDIEQLKYTPTKKSQISHSINESFDTFQVYIDSLFSLPSISNIKSVRISARLCYGNQTKARQTTRSMSFVRNTYHSEIYNDEIDSSSSSICETFDGIPMRLIGWCSQALFDDEHYLITGERYLGIFDALTTNRTGFYSLRNVFERNCPILSVSFLDQSFVWPHVQARNDKHPGNFTEMSRDKQENLCRLLKRPSLILVDHSAMTTNDNRKQQYSSNTSDEEREFSEDECHFLWSHRYFVIHKPYALPKLLKSRCVWDYPSLIDIYGLINDRQQSSNNIFGVYPYARTAILHVANAIMPTSYQRQQSIRLPSTKSRHHDR
ncbi:unnamed protein product [Rotaria sp. Silwood1]|nr:unnamed protein product [Rotaria sp. Silwood1]